MSRELIDRKKCEQMWAAAQRDEPEKVNFYEIGCDKKDVALFHRYLAGPSHALANNRRQESYAKHDRWISDLSVVRDIWRPVRCFWVPRVGLKRDSEIPYHNPNVIASAAGALLQKAYPMMATSNASGVLIGIELHRHQDRAIAGVPSWQLPSGRFVTMAKEGHEPTRVPGDLRPLFYEEDGDHDLEDEMVAQLVECRVTDIEMVKPIPITLTSESRKRFVKLWDDLGKEARRRLVKADLQAERKGRGKHEVERQGKIEAERRQSQAEGGKLIETGKAEDSKKSGRIESLRKPLPSQSSAFRDADESHERRNSDHGTGPSSRDARSTSTSTKISGNNDVGSHGNTRLNINGIKPTNLANMIDNINPRSGTTRHTNESTKDRARVGHVSMRRPDGQTIKGPDSLAGPFENFNKIDTSAAIDEHVGGGGNGTKRKSDRSPSPNRKTEKINKVSSHTFFNKLLQQVTGDEDKPGEK